MGREQQRPRRGCGKGEAPERRRRRAGGGTGVAAPDEAEAGDARSCIAAAAAAAADWVCCLAGEPAVMVMVLDLHSWR